MEPLTTVDKSIFSKYPINHYGEIWDKLTRLDFSKNAALPIEVLCFLEKGTVRKYFSDTSKELSTEISIDFYFEGDIFTAKADSGLEKEFLYESIEEGTLWYVDMATVRQMFFESKLCGATQKIFMEERLREQTIREIQLMRATPEELYTHLLTHKPHFIQRIPLKYLCSYIGITPQALSRIRKRIT
jgi:CRP-like cAMP-binding protein